MGTVIQQIWGKMWKDHDRTKKMFRFFSLRNSTQIESNEDKKNVKTKGQHVPPKRTKPQNIGLVLGPVLFFAILFGFNPDGLSYEAKAVLAGTIWVATWWITEALPIAATSLLPLVLFPLSGAVESPGDISGSYGDDTVFLFMGGFLIAIAMEKWNLHKRIALSIISIVGTSTQQIVLGFMVATGFLSMWISNTATAMMMLPIALAVIKSVKDNLDNEADFDPNFGKQIMLGVGYAASIGGLGTLIGTPPNSIFAGVVKEMYGIEITFAQWMMLGVPLVIILLTFLYFYFKISLPLKTKELPGGRQVILDQKKGLGRMSMEEILVLFVFLLAAFSWTTRSFFLSDFLEKLIPGLKIDDTLIAMFCGILLFLLPSKRSEDGMILNWNDAGKLPWGVLLLFGGGFALSKGFTLTGLDVWVGEQLTVLSGINLVLIIASITIIIILLSEIASNTAAATMMYPIMAALALAIDVHPLTLMVTAGLAASCAFMLPVATPPNAIVFGSGYLKMKDMIKAGFWLDVASLIVIILAVFFWLPIVWGFEIGVFPSTWK